MVHLVPLVVIEGIKVCQGSYANLTYLSYIVVEHGHGQRCQCGHVKLKSLNRKNPKSNSHKVWQRCTCYIDNNCGALYVKD